jgi:lysophospholipase L1-like esterase
MKKFLTLAVLMLSVSGTAAYEGVVTTRNQLLDAFDKNAHSANSRSVLYTFQPGLQRLRVVAQNFITDEHPVGCSVTYTGSVEYPMGTFSQLLFDGVPSTTLPDLSIKFSDYLTLPTPIQPGVPGWVHFHLTSPCGIPYQNIMFSNGRWGDSFYVCACADLPDSTMGGPGGNGTATNGFVPPIAVLGETSLPTFVSWGDSIEWGAGWQPMDHYGNVGPVSRSLGMNFAHLKFARSGEAMTTITSGGNALRRSLLKYASASVNALGVNDFVSRATHDMVTNAQTIAGWSQADFPGAQTFAIAFTMRDRSSTGKWTTLAEQTIAATGYQEQDRVDYNTGCRAGFPFLTACFDIASKVESSTNSGKWRVDMGRITMDGIHPNTAGAALMASGYVPKLLHYP